MDGPETVIALSAVGRNSGPIALILLWGPLKITFIEGWSGPPDYIVLGPSQPLGSQTLLYILACLIQKCEWFPSASSFISPSKKTFTVGKTNTDNNDIEFGGFFGENRHLETSYLNILSPQLLHFSLNVCS